MYRSIITLPVIALAMAASPWSAVAQQHLVAGGGPMSFDVAGVRLGASPDDVKAAPKRAGYVVTYVATEQTLQQQAQFEADRRLGRSVRWPKEAGMDTIHASGPHQESAIVDFIQHPGGSAVSSVTVQVPGSAMTGDALRAQAMAKYGKPDASHSQGTEMVWCAADALAVCGKSFVPSGHYDTDYPKLSIGTGANGGTIDLKIGQFALDQAKKDKDAAVERLAPKTSQAA